MSAFEDFVNLELPKRPPMLTLANTGYDNDPNLGGAPAVVQNSPQGTYFFRNTGSILYVKNSSSPGTWAVVGSTAGDPIETVDRTVYVSPTGNDSTGDGSIGSPYLTIAKARSAVATDVAADITIKLAAGTYTEFVNDFRNFRADSVTAKASLLFDGDFADFTPATGPASGTFDASFGTPYIPNTAVLTGATWTVNDLKGAFVEILAGADLGKRFPIASNTVDTLDIGGPAIAGGVELRSIAFKFVKSSVIILHPLTATTALVSLSGSTNKAALATVALKPRGAFQFYGITFRATTARPLVLAFSDVRVESCVFDQASTASLPTATSMAPGRSGVLLSAVNCYFGAAVVANTQITHLNSGTTRTAGTVSGNFCVMDGGFTGLLAGAGSTGGLSNCLIQGPRSSGISLAGGSGSYPTGLIIRNMPTGFVGMLLGGNPGAFPFLFTSQLVAGSAKIYGVTAGTGLACSGLASNTSGTIRNLIIDGCATGVWVGSAVSQLSWQNSSIINNTGFGVRVGPGFLTGLEPFYSGFVFSAGGLTMSGNVSGDLTFDGVTAYTPASVSAQPDKTLINARGNYFLGN